MRERPKIIYIEDQFEQYSDRIKMLEENGYDVEPIENVDDAYEKLNENRYDLILLDIMMPPGNKLAHEDVKGGFETGLILAKRIRNEGCNKDTPIIVITGNPDTRLEYSLKNLGVKAYLKKPASQVELEEEINKALKE